MSRNMSAGNKRISKNGGKETYTVQKFLGNGAFGKAYLIKSNETQIYYVIKSISLKFLDNKDGAQVINEGLLLKRIDHPNIIHFKECFKNLNPVPQLNIIMEYANGGDISQKLKNQMPNHFEENLLIDWLSQLCNALQYIHNKKIIHRDIKPANIFLNNLGQIKLGDFGISKNLETIKMASTFIGSLDYLAPEIINGQNYSFEADIWSLGVTFYELMTFKKPFIGNFPVIYLKIVNDKFEPINDDLYSKDFRNLVYQMLNKDPKKRPKPKDIIGMNFVRNRMLSYLQEKKFNLKDSFNLIQDYQRKKKQKYYNYNNIKKYININFDKINNINSNNNNIIKIRFSSGNNNNNNIIKNNKNKINSFNNNNNDVIKFKFNLKSEKGLDRKLINERYKIIGDKENKNEKLSAKDKINELRYNSMQLAEKRNKITLSTKIVNNKAFGEANKIISNSKEKEKPIDLIATNTINTINGNEKDKYDFHRQMNIFSSILNGVKTDEQIEEENNILLKCNDD
jgi:serine/threonine protein kinase